MRPSQSLAGVTICRALKAVASQNLQGQTRPTTGFFSSRRGSLRCVKPSRLMLAASKCVVLSPIPLK